MKIFLFLNDCLLGENTTMEILFAFIKNKSWKEIKSLLSTSNTTEFINKHFELINFNNLFLRQEVVNWLQENSMIDKEEIYIVSDLPHVPLQLLNLGRNATVLSYEDYKKEIKTEDTILITGEFWPSYKVFFNCKKVLFVGPYLLGKIVNMLTVGRTEIIHRPYGIFTIIWDYFINFFSNLDILWPLLFFLPSTNFYLWVKCFFIGSLLSGIVTLWRHLLELEEERRYLVNGEEVLMGGNFLYLHYSTYGAFLTSIILTVMIITYGFTSFINMKALFYGALYSMGHFLFVTRSFKEKVLAKIFILLILTTFIQPNWLKEMIMTVYENYWN